MYEKSVTAEEEQISSKRSGKTMTPILLAGLVMSALLLQAQQASAILNCFSPKSMFNKLAKGGHQQVGYAGGGPERANWYPQHYQQQQQQPAHNQYLPYAMHQYPSMKSLLFQPKWKAGSSLLGNKNWPPGGWRQMGASSNFYRPGYGYGSPGGYGGGFLFGAYPQQANYPQHSTSDLLAGSGYSPLLNTPGSNDGWTVPSQHQIGSSSHDAAGYAQQIIRQQPIIDPYGSVKGGSRSTTKKGNILLADGGYSAFDAHLANRNKTYGYAYPDSYSAGVVESPAKIAQQLAKYGLRQQRLQQQSIARLAPLLLSPNNSNSRLVSGNLLEEPRFVGFGVTDVLNNLEARLSCSFNEPIDQNSRAGEQPAWIKFVGPYNSTQMSGANIVPPFDCASLQCRAQEIDSLRDSRYRLDNGPATSTLIIAEPRSSDYGVYRCSAISSKVSQGNSNLSSPRTIYKVVELGNSASSTR